MIPLLAIPMGVASGINYYLSFEVPITSSTTETNDFLYYSAITGLAVQPFTVHQIIHCLLVSSWSHVMSVC
jgi:hypothetical protein